jgi:hypothetical protein
VALLCYGADCGRRYIYLSTGYHVLVSWRILSGEGRERMQLVFQAGYVAVLQVVSVVVL